MNNETKPTDAALKCAKALQQAVGGLYEWPNSLNGIVAAIIDKHCDLPRMTRICLSAQGVVDRFDKNDATDALEAIDNELRAALETK